MREHRTTFESVGEPIAGLLYLPAERPRAAIVTTGPLTSVKEQAAGAYAKAMAARGYAALAFDHRYFGESGGQPRQFENPLAKIEDFGNAVAFLESDERTRGMPVCAIGVCAGGGYMARAVAGLPRIRVFAGVAGVYSDAAQTKAAMGAGFLEALERSRAADTRWRQAGYAEMIPAVALGNGDVAMPLDEAYEYYGTPRGAVPNYVNSFAVQSRAFTLTFDARSAASAITAPTLIVHSEKALAPGLARSFFASLAAPKEELWISSKGQIDFYDDPSIINPAADAVARFFDKWL
jgi:fermentation-respiration switch protein FrsA (DUF1100 family)